MSKSLTWKYKQLVGSCIAVLCKLRYIKAWELQARPYKTRNCSQMSKAQSVMYETW